MFALTFSITKYDHERFDVVGVHPDEAVLQALADEGNRLIKACALFDVQMSQRSTQWHALHPQPRINVDLLSKSKRGPLKANEQAIVDEYTRLNQAWIVAHRAFQEENKSFIQHESVDVQQQYAFGGSDGYYEVVACRDLSQTPSLFA